MNKYLPHNHNFYHSYTHQRNPKPKKPFVGATPTKFPLPADSLLQRPIPKVWLHLYPNKYKPTSIPIQTTQKYGEEQLPSSVVLQGSVPMHQNKIQHRVYKPTSKPPPNAQESPQNNVQNQFDYWTDNLQPVHSPNLWEDYLYDEPDDSGLPSLEWMPVLQGPTPADISSEMEVTRPSPFFKPTSRPLGMSVTKRTPDLQLLPSNNMLYKPTSRPRPPATTTARPQVNQVTPPSTNSPWHSGQIIGIIHYKPTHTPDQLQQQKPPSAIDNVNFDHQTPSAAVTATTLATTTTTTASTTLKPTKISYKPTVKPGNAIVPDLVFNLPNRPQQTENLGHEPGTLSDIVTKTTTTTSTPSTTIPITATSTTTTTVTTITPTVTFVTTSPTSQVFGLYDIVEGIAQTVDRFLRSIFDINVIGKTVSDLTEALSDTSSSASILFLVLGIPLITALLTFAGVGPLVIIASAWVVPLAAALFLPGSLQSELENTVSRLVNI